VIGGHAAISNTSSAQQTWQILFRTCQVFSPLSKSNYSTKSMKKRYWMPIFPKFLIPILDHKKKCENWALRENGSAYAIAGFSVKFCLMFIPRELKTQCES